MFDALLWNLLVTTTLAFVLASICRWTWMARRPALRHALWLLLLAKMITPPLISAPLLPAIEPVADSVADIEVSTTTPIYEASIPLARTPTEPGAASLNEPAKTGVIERIWQTAKPHLLAGLLAASAAVTLVLLAIHAIRGLALTRWLRRAGERNERLTACCDEVAAELGLRSPVRSCVVEARTTPMLWGLWRPTVVVTREMLDQLSPEQLRSIVAHELAHIVRRDPWSNLFAFLVKMLMWWNPIAWWAHREVRAAQELCCDAVAINVGSRSCYAQTLLQAVDYSQVGSMAQRELVLAMGAKNSMLRRFEMIADAKLSHRSPRWTHWLLAALILPLLCMPVRGRDDSDDANPKTVETAKRDDAAADDSKPAAKEKEPYQLTDDSEPAPLTGENPNFVFLVAIIQATNKEEVRKAWILDRTLNKRTILTKGDQFRVGRTSAAIAEIEKDLVLLTVGDGLKAWKLGASFTNTRTVTAAKPPAGGIGGNTKKPKNEEKRFKVELELVGDNLVVRGAKEDVARVTKLLEKLNLADLKKGDDSEPKAKEPALIEAYALQGLDGEMVVAVLQALFTGEPDVRVAYDPKKGNLIVFGRRKTQDEVRRLLTALSGPAKAKPGNNAPDAKFKLSFHKQPWHEVLDWYAKQAGLAVSIKEPINGTLTFSDSRAYTAAEMMDLLNRVLATQERTLVRDGRWLFVLSLDPGDIRELAPRITTSELAERGRYEYVTVLFALGTKDGEAIRKEIMPLLSKAGSAALLPKSQMLIVTERAGIMRAVHEVIQAINKPQP